MPRHRLVDAAAVLAVLAAGFALHPLGPILRERYWLDECWVALSSKASLGQVPLLTSSSPIGWTFLVWLLPPSGQVHRLVPFAFLIGSTLAAWCLGRQLRWPTRTQATLAGLVGAAAVLLVPATGMRYDTLKQYTADAAVTLALLVLAAWAESAWSRRRAAALGAAMLAVLALSHVSVFVGAAVLCGLAGVAVARRRWPMLAAAAILGVLTAAVAGVLYLRVDRVGRSGAMYAYWHAYFPTPRGLPHYLLTRLHELQPALGAPWPLVLALAAAGVVAVARLGRPATAVALALLPVEAVGAGVARKYPLLDGRTSHFLLITGAVLAGIGTVYVLYAAIRPGWAGRVAGTVAARTVAARTVAARTVAAVLVVAAVCGYAVANRGTWAHPGQPVAPAEDIRAQVRYVAEHRRPGDVIVVNEVGEYGFAYYWSADAPRFVEGGTMTTGWLVRYPKASGILIADSTDSASIDRSWAAALAMAGPSGRIWLVRTHMATPEPEAWTRLLAGSHTQTFAVGPEPLLLVTNG